MAEGKKPRLAAILDLLRASGVKDEHLAELQTLYIDSGYTDPVGGTHVHLHIDTTGDGRPDIGGDIDKVT